MAAAGLGEPSVDPDGAIHRYRLPGDKNGVRSGWYQLVRDSSGQFSGVYGNSKTGDSHTWPAPGPVASEAPAARCVATNTGLAVTILRSTRPALLTKRFDLAEDGTLKKTSIAQMTEGTATQTTVADLAGFLGLLDGLPQSAAVTYGIATGHPSARVVASAKHTEDSAAITLTRRFFQFRRAPGVMFLDYDPPRGDFQEGQTPPPLPPHIKDGISPADLIATLRSVAPCLADAPMLWRPSASSGIVHATTGEPLTGRAGQWIYIPVADAALIPDAGKALVTLLWAAGYGRIEIGAAGQALERTLVDASVWQPERLDFAAPPSLGPGLRREPQAAFIDGDQGELCDLRRLIEAADGTIKARTATARKTAKVTVADPLEPDYGQDRRIAWANLRSGGRPYLHSHARRLRPGPDHRGCARLANVARVADRPPGPDRGVLFGKGRWAKPRRDREDRPRHA